MAGRRVRQRRKSDEKGGCECERSTIPTRMVGPVNRQSTHAQLACIAERHRRTVELSLVRSHSVATVLMSRQPGKPRFVRLVRLPAFRSRNAIVVGRGLTSAEPNRLLSQILEMASLIF